MTKRLYERTADLKKYPEVFEADDTEHHVTIGDLHGNALKFIHTLMEEGILELSSADYDRLQQIYYRNYTGQLEKIKPDLDEFKRIIAGARVNIHRSLTLIGDEFADRGNNDYFTLLVLKKLVEAQLDVSITLSNHGAEFIKMQDINYQCHMDYSFVQSYVTVQELFDLQLIDPDEINELVVRYYLPLIKAIDYTITPDGTGITLFSHAPIGLETIQSLAKDFGIPYSEANLNAFIHTLDRINASVSQLVHAFPPDPFIARLQEEQERANHQQPIPPEASLYRLIFNRKVGQELRLQPDSAAFNVSFVHGHVGDEDIYVPDFTPPANTHTNLDNYFGKSNEFHVTNPNSSPPIHHFTLQSSELTANHRKTKLEQNVYQSMANTDLLRLLIDHGYGLSDLFELPSSQYSLEARDHFLRFLQQEKPTSLDCILTTYEIAKLLTLKKDHLTDTHHPLLLALLPRLNPNGAWLHDLIILLGKEERKHYCYPIVTALSEQMNRIIQSPQQLDRLLFLPEQILNAPVRAHLINTLVDWNTCIPDLDAFYQFLTLPIDKLSEAQRRTPIDIDDGKLMSTLIPDSISLFILFRTTHSKELSFSHRDSILQTVLSAHLSSWIERENDSFLYDLFLLESYSLSDKHREFILNAVFQQQHNQDRISCALEKLLALPADKLSDSFRKTIRERCLPVRPSTPDAFFSKAPLVDSPEEEQSDDDVLCNYGQGYLSS